MGHCETSLRMVDSSIPEADERGVWVSEEADHHVPIEDGHGRLVTVLPPGDNGIRVMIIDVDK